MRHSAARRASCLTLLCFAGAACSGGSGGLGDLSQGDPASTGDGGPTQAGGPMGAGAPGAGVREAGALPSGDSDSAGPKLPSFPAVDDFAAAGPFETISESTDADCTVYRPSTLGEEGRRHPVILWGNGTGTPTVEVYSGFFAHWASHGFIVAAAHTPNAGGGQEMLACLLWVEAQHALSGSPYEGHVDLGNVGASGHSQGGGGAVMVGQDPRVRATVPFQAWTGSPAHMAGAEMRQNGPMFLVSGDADLIAAPEANQKPIFEASNVATFWGTLAGGDHVTIALGNVAAYLGPSVAWFRLHLMGDEDARPMFYGQDCALCADPNWTSLRKQID